MTEPICSNQSPVFESCEQHNEHRSALAYNVKKCLVIGKPGNVVRERERDEKFFSGGYVY